MINISSRRLCGIRRDLSATSTNYQFNVKDGGNSNNNNNLLFRRKDCSSFHSSKSTTTSQANYFVEVSNSLRSKLLKPHSPRISPTPQDKKIFNAKHRGENTFIIDLQHKISSSKEPKNTALINNTNHFSSSPLLDRKVQSFIKLHCRNISATFSKMAKLLSGKEVSDEIRAKLKAQVETMSIKPKLAIVQVGGREDSNVYIRMKIQFAESIGASAELIKLSRDISEEELSNKVKELNANSSVHGIITQLPFDCSQEIDSDKIVNLIDPSKDVDGLCAYNAGKLLHGELNNSSSFIPCTPNGCMELIKKSGLNLAGANAVVIGRSKIVGSPMAQLLLWNNATVTICHSKTKNLEDLCRQADIIVAAVGRARMVKGSWLKAGCVVIDCGINVIPDATKKSGTRLVGDVDFDECKEIASAITPVPGGVGPMTVAMLISNTVLSASRRQ